MYKVPEGVDPYAAIAGAVVHRAIVDARKGDRGALLWLRGTGYRWVELIREGAGKAVLATYVEILEDENGKDT